MIEYEEGIYVGYKYYETAAADGFLTKHAGYDAAKATLPANVTDTYYNRSTGVVYPFGFGLSYTEFTQTLNSVTVSGEDVTVNVTVKNTGDVAGKDIVQVYWSQTDWEVGDLEKAAVNLVDFAKTKELAPKEEQTLEITFDKQDLASWDKTANSNKGAYVLEDGTYEISIRSDSHNKISGESFAVENNDIVYTTSAGTDNEVGNVFSNNDMYNTSRQASWMADGQSTLKVMQRGKFETTYPTGLTVDDGARKFSDAFVKDFQYDVTQQTYFAYQDKTTDPWYVEEAGSTWKQATAEDVAKRVNGKTEILLPDMTGVAQDDAKWDTFLNQLTYEEMIKLIVPGSFGSGDTTASEAIGRPKVSEADGPIQFSSGTFWVSAVNQGATWNTDLIEQHGVLIGNESLFLGVNGWYGPGMNIHRAFFDGRAFEYYSCDGVLSGKMAAAAIVGAQSKGCNVYLKHFALNEQSTSRMGLVVWADEQAMREIYLKAFEIPVKAGKDGVMSIMTSFCQVGAVAAPANYALNVKLARNEWGFQGVAQTDMFMAYSVLLPGNSLVRSYNFPMGSYSGTSVIEGVYDAEKNMIYVAKDAAEYTAGEHTLASPTQWAAVRNTCKAFLWNAANSNQAQNGYKLSNLVKDVTVNAVEGVSITQSVALDTSATGAFNVVYSASNLPQGLTLSKDGVLSGTPVKSAEFTVTVTADDWVKTTYKVKVNVASAITVTGELTGETEKAFEATFTVNEQAISGWDEGSLYYDIEGAPAGLTIDEETGKLSGTPTEAGTFTVTVTANGTKTTTGGGGGSGGSGGGTTAPTTTPQTIKATFTITINGESAIGGDSYVTVDEVKAMLDKVGGLTEEQVQAMIDAASTGGLTEAQVQALIDAALAENGSGCSGSISGISAFATLALMLGAATVFIIVRKSRKDNK